MSSLQVLALATQSPDLLTDEAERSHYRFKCYGPLVTGDSVRIETIHLFEPDTPPLKGDPDKLLEEWQLDDGRACRGVRGRP